MEKIQSFKVDHMVLVPGIYVSRIDNVGTSRTPVTTFDIRLKRPNFDDPMSPPAVHTIEHIGATFLRNNPAIKDYVIYFGPMGCMTGFYLILDGEYSYSKDKSGYMRVVEILMDMMRFIVKFNDIIPGYSPVECGNYTFHDLEEAKNVAGNFLVLYETFGSLLYEYPTPEENPGICRASTVNYTDRLSREAINAYRTMEIRDASTAFDIPDDGNYVCPVKQLKLVPDIQELPISPTLELQIPQKVESYALF